MTLGEWRDLAASVFGASSPALQFLEGKITDQGEDEEVLADYGQMLILLSTLDRQ